MGRTVAKTTLVVGSAGAVAKAATEYSETLRFHYLSTGEQAVVVTSTAGSITVTQQCSIDGKTWYSPVDSSGNALGTVCTAQAVTTGSYIVYTPVVSEWVRFKVVEGNSAATTVTLKLIYQEDN